MPPDFHSLVRQARKLVAYTNRDFAELTGVSIRTVERHVHNGGISSGFQTDRLVAAVHPKDPGLARQLAAAGGRTLADAGVIEAPAKPLVSREHADSVLLAAANALHLPPEDVRPAVAAALARAHELNVHVGGLAEHLSRPGPGVKAAAPPPKSKTGQ